MKIAIYCVTYNSYPSLASYLESIDKAAAACQSCQVSVFVADNTTSAQQPINSNWTHISVMPFLFYENHGYFGAIGRMMREVAPSAYDLVIISNVDMSMRPDTLQKLRLYNYPADCGWLATAIIKKGTNSDYNPEAMRRYTRLQLLIRKLYFRIPALEYINRKTLYKRKKAISHEAGKIYAGHGSFIVLTREFFKHIPFIDYPIFLFMEEFYLAEECIKHGLKVVYDPSIAVDDIGRINTATIRKSNNRKWHLQGINFILDHYYNR